MRLICPACFAIASLEIWSNDPAARDVVDIISKLPAPVASRAPAYLALFRRGKRGLSWTRALKLLTELQKLVAAGTVHWEGEEERPAPPELWGAIMDKMFTRKWDPPLEDHNWLRKVVWSEARPLAVEKEQKIHHRGTENTENAQRNAEATSAGGPTVPRRRGCFVCAAFRPPMRCEADSRPVSGNQVMGCDKWRAKVASAANVMNDLAAGLKEVMGGQENDDENAEGGL
jgi:hypothetical protein